MISILSSKQYYTFISFYLIISQNFDKKNIDLLTSLYQQYDFFNITFIKIDKKYENSFVSRHITKEAYYRFSLGELLPFLNKIIYLDGDTIIFRDLTKFYNLNFNGKIILGQVTGNNKSKKDHIYKINSGILLLNLKKMREIKMEKLTINILNKGEKLYYHDQTLINQYFHEYVGIYPPEFHSRKFNDYLRVKKWNKISGNIYDNDYLYFSWKYPTIRHYLGRSKYKNNNFVKNYDWFYFARKSKYFKKKTSNISEIFNY
jgi:lipopolysaccharide biosynthesis glycosyltransferase